MTTRGVTLTELLVAMVLVSFIMMGVFSANTAIQFMDKTQTAKVTLLMQAQAIVDVITLDARNAIGSRNDAGVRVGTDYVCFRNTLATAAYPDTSPSWKCYSKFGYELRKCVRTVALGEGACVLTDEYIGTMVNDFNSTPDIDGTVHSLPALTAAGFSMPVINRSVPGLIRSSTNPQVDLYVTAYPEAQSW